MHATNVINLKKNPSLALRQVEELPALAASLFKDDTLSLDGATRLSGMPLQSFIQFLAELGIDVVRPDEASDLEAKDISAWLAS